MNVCHIHGGKTPAGVASPHFKTGRHSKHMPGRLLERYEEALADGDLLNLRSEIALIDTRIAMLIEMLDQGDFGARWLQLKQTYQLMAQSATAKDLGAGKAAFEVLGDLIQTGADEVLTWSQISDVVEQRRKLVETERKRLVDSQQFLTTEEAMLLVSAVVSLIKKRVHDRQILAEIQADVIQLMSQSDRGRLEPG